MSLTPDQQSQAAQRLHALRTEIEVAVVGQTDAVNQTLMSLLAGGHVLLEGVPGLGKTLLARALSKVLSLDFARVQFTPDLMPSDIVGHSVLDTATGGATPSLRVSKGPVFTHLLLADEINRAPAKTQSALLEVMQETQVTLEGVTLPLPRPFMVIATQNPIDSEGTYALPEAQRDRFLMKVDLGYPSAAHEVDLVRRATWGRAGDDLAVQNLQARLDQAQLLELQRWVIDVDVSDAVLDYAVRIARATRAWPGLALGAGSRASISLVRVGRAAALMQGRDYVIPDDIKQYALPVLRHRVSLAPDAQMEGRSVDELLAELLQSIDAPRT